MSETSVTTTESGATTNSATPSKPPLAKDRRTGSLVH